MVPDKTETFKENIMIIDFHTHIFPDKIAPKAIPQLAERAGVDPRTDGTAEGLLHSMAENGIDVSVILPVVTDPHQFDSIFRFALEVNEKYSGSGEHRLISLAGIHPDCPDIPLKMRSIARAGFKGVKLHPHYHRVAFDDIRSLRLIEAASEEGLFVLTHAGYDPISPEHDYCTPDMILHVLKETVPYRLILAHMGSNCNYQESLERLCGLNVYMDTGYCLTDIPESLFVRMVHKHGADRILFATDCPWGDQGGFAGRLQSMTGLSLEEKELILGL